MAHNATVYGRLLLAVTGRSRTELGDLAHHPLFTPTPSVALVDDLSQVLAGHTQVGRSLPLHEVVVGLPTRGPSVPRIATPLLVWIRENSYS